MRAGLAVALLALALIAAPAEAKKFKYAAGPKPSVDTTFTTAQAEVEPIVRPRGPKVPATNLQLVNLVANTAFSRALKSAPLDSGGHVVLAPAESHPLNFVVEHAVLRELARRGVTATVRRTILPDDSLATFATAGDPLLEYQLATARVTYLRLVGWLPFSGRVKIERQALDAFPKDRVNLVEEARYSDLKSAVPSRNVDKVFEPVIVVAVVAGLVALFFQNRP